MAGSGCQRQPPGRVPRGGRLRRHVGAVGRPVHSGVGVEEPDRHHGRPQEHQGRHAQPHAARGGPIRVGQFRQYRQLLADPLVLAGILPPWQERRPGQRLLHVPRRRQRLQQDHLVQRVRQHRPGQGPGFLHRYDDRRREYLLEGVREGLRVCQSDRQRRVGGPAAGGPPAHARQSAVAAHLAPARELDLPERPQCRNRSENSCCSGRHHRSLHPDCTFRLGGFLLTDQPVLDGFH